MKRDEKYNVILKLAEKYFGSDVNGSLPKKTVSLPASCEFSPAILEEKNGTCQETKTPSESAISIINQPI